MAAPRILILRAPGTNCDLETAHAFRLAGGEPTLMHVNQLLEDSDQTDQFEILCFPGGFSYGDDIAAGRILANQLRLNLADKIQQFKTAGKLILGICNGFQVLIKSGVLLADDDQGPVATLDWNDSGRFEDRWVQLSVDSDRCVFLNGVQSMYLPVAHAEGKFVARNDNQLSQLSSGGQLSLRYTSANGGNGSPAYPENPNGSQADVAGVCDESGRVFGLMPHPERFVDPTQHPRWTRGEAGAVGDGLIVFQNAVRFFN